MKKSLSYQMNKRLALALLIFAGLTLLIQTYFFYYKSLNDNNKSLVSQLHFVLPENHLNNLKPFNPNLLTSTDWEALGFSKNQVKTIIKYKEIVGGEFTSKEQLKKCYAISEEKFQLLESYLILPEKSSSRTFNSESKYEKKLNISRSFNPDQYSASDWENLGFSEKQAAAILKYKSYLGGSFVSKELLKECFIINDAQFAQLSPHLLLPNKTPAHFNKRNNATNSKINYTKFDPNLLSQQDWQKLGFTEKQAVSILNYKTKILKGNFKTLDDIKNCFMISEAKFEEMKSYIVINPIKTESNNQPQTTEIQQTDFANIDLNKITFKQLIEYGFDEKAAASLLGFRKKLGGFVNAQLILDTYNVDKDLATKLVNTAKLNTNGIVKYNLVNAPEDWLKNHPFFKYSADKIIFYRMTYPDDEKIFKYLKLKPEYEKRMRLYLTE